MYHPAAALHQGSLRGAIEEDFDQLGKLISKARSERDREDEPSPEGIPAHQQMNLF
jgi:DNA polymerase